MEGKSRPQLPRTNSDPSLEFEEGTAGSKAAEKPAVPKLQLKPSRDDIELSRINGATQPRATTARCSGAPTAVHLLNRCSSLPSNFKAHDCSSMMTTAGGASFLERSGAYEGGVTVPQTRTEAEYIGWRRPMRTTSLSPGVEQGTAPAPVVVPDSDESKKHKKKKKTKKKEDEKNSDKRKHSDKKKSDKKEKKKWKKKMKSLTRKSKKDGSPVEMESEEDEPGPAPAPSSSSSSSVARPGAPAPPSSGTACFSLFDHSGKSPNSPRLVRPSAARPDNPLQSPSITPRTNSPSPPIMSPRSAFRPNIASPRTRRVTVSGSPLGVAQGSHPSAFIAAFQGKRHSLGATQ